MDWEFELDYRQHPAHRFVMYGVVGVLVAGVGYLIVKTWKTIASGPLTAPGENPTLPGTS